MLRVMKLPANDTNMQRVDVSVIIITHNRISMLEEALASVYAKEFDGIIEANGRYIALVDFEDF